MAKPSNNQMIDKIIGIKGKSSEKSRRRMVECIRQHDKNEKRQKQQQQQQQGEDE